jgi:hypothetical protein
MPTASSIKPKCDKNQDMEPRLYHAVLYSHLLWQPSFLGVPWTRVAWAGLPGGLYAVASEWIRQASDHPLRSFILLAFLSLSTQVLFQGATERRAAWWGTRALVALFILAQLGLRLPLWPSAAVTLGSGVGLFFLEAGQDTHVLATGFRFWRAPRWWRPF